MIDNSSKGISYIAMDIFNVISHICAVLYWNSNKRISYIVMAKAEPAYRAGLTASSVDEAIISYPTYENIRVAAPLIVPDQP